MSGGVPCGCDGHFAVPSPARAPSGRLHARPPGEVCVREVWVLLASTCVLSCARVLCVAIVGTMSLLPIGSSRRSRSSRRATEDALADGSRSSRRATEDTHSDDEDVYYDSGRAGKHAGSMCAPAAPDAPLVHSACCVSRSASVMRAAVTTYNHAAPRSRRRAQYPRPTQTTPRTAHRQQVEARRTQTRRSPSPPNSPHATCGPARRRARARPACIATLAL